MCVCVCVCACACVHVCPSLIPNEKLGLIGLTVQQLMNALLNRIPDIKPVDCGRPGGGEEQEQQR